MSIADNYIPVVETGNGVTTQFTGTWNPILLSYLRVYLQDIDTGVQTLQVEGVDYTSATVSTGGFRVTFLEAPTDGYLVVIARVTPQNQVVPYRTSKGFDGANTEASYDKLTAMVQEQQDTLDRTLSFPLGSSLTGQLPLVPIDGATLVFDGVDGNVTNGPTLTDIAAAQVYAEAAEAAADFAAAQAAATITIPSNSIITPTHADGTTATLANLLGSFLMPEMFAGATDRAKVDACRTAAETYGINWKLFPGKVYDMGSEPFTVDPTKARYSSDGVSWLQFSKAYVDPEAEILVELDQAYMVAKTDYLSGPSYAQFPKYAQECGRGVVISGGGQFTQFIGTGFQAGDGTHIMCQFDFYHYVQGFLKTNRPMNNTWRIGFLGSSRWGRIQGFIDGTVPTNSGELMRIGGMLGDAQGVNSEFNYGGWTAMPGTSLDNFPIIVRNDAKFVAINPHIENPGAANQHQRYITLEDEAYVCLDGGIIVHNTPTNGPALDPIILNNAHGQDEGHLCGLALRNVQIANWNTDNYNTTAEHVHNLLVQGLGRTTCSGLTIVAATNGQSLVISRAIQELINGDFSGDTLGATPAHWTKADSGSGTATITWDIVSSPVIANTPSWTGTGKAMRIKIAWASGGSKTTTVYSDPMRCQPGDLVMVSLPQYLDFATGTGTGSFARVTEVLDASGNIIGSFLGISYTADAPAYSAKGGHFNVPKGAFSYRQKYSLTVTAGTVSCYLTDLLINRSNA